MRIIRKIFNEYDNKISLKAWNKVQQDIWLQLSNMSYVVRNDFTTFSLFAKYFDAYYHRNNKFPSVWDVIRYLNSIRK
jgi:hypothetical protein